jgi:hypothetical protein
VRRHVAFIALLIGLIASQSASSSIIRVDLTGQTTLQLSTASFPAPSLPTLRFSFTYDDQAQVTSTGFHEVGYGGSLRRYKFSYAGFSYDMSPMGSAGIGITNDDPRQNVPTDQVIVNAYHQQPWSTSFPPYDVFRVSTKISLAGDNGFLSGFDLTNLWRLPSPGTATFRVELFNFNGVRLATFDGDIVSISSGVVPEPAPLGLLLAFGGILAVYRNPLRNQ